MIHGVVYYEGMGRRSPPNPLRFFRQCPFQLQIPPTPMTLEIRSKALVTVLLASRRRPRRSPSYRKGRLLGLAPVPARRNMTMEGLQGVPPLEVL